MKFPRQSVIISVVLVCIGILWLQPIKQAKANDSEKVFTEALTQGVKAINQARNRRLRRTTILTRGRVLLLQRSLNSLGYNTGKPDGKLGRKTERALINFLRKNGHNPRTTPIHQALNLVVEEFEQRAASNNFNTGKTGAHGIDCARVTKPDEFMICRNDHLYGLDQELNAAYARAQSIGNKALLRATQREWLALRAKCENSIRCLIVRYRSRIDVLNLVSRKPPPDINKWTSIGTIPQGMDCSRASKPDEVAICESKHVYQLDKKLNIAYARAKAVTDVTELRTKQREWLSQRARCGWDLECLANNYITRISTLNEIVNVSLAGETPEPRINSGTGADQPHYKVAAKSHSNSQKTYSSHETTGFKNQPAGFKAFLQKHLPSNRPLGDTIISNRGKFAGIFRSLLAITADSDLLINNVNISGYYNTEPYVNLLGKEVVSRYFSRTGRFKGDNEFEKNDTKKGFLAEQGPELRAMIPVFPLKLKSISTFSFGKYDHKRKGFFIQPRNISPLRGSYVDIRYSGMPKRNERIFWSMDEGKARTLLETLRQDAPKKNRTAVLVVDYTLKGVNLKFDGSSSELIASVEPTNVAAFSNKKLSRHITDFPLSFIFKGGVKLANKPKSEAVLAPQKRTQPSVGLKRSRNNNHTVVLKPNSTKRIASTPTPEFIKMEDQPAGFQKFLQKHLHPNRRLGDAILSHISLLTMSDRDVPKFDYKSGRGVKFSRAFSALLKITTDPSLLRAPPKRSYYRFYVDLLSKQVVGKYFNKHGGVLGADEFQQRDTIKKFITEQGPNIARMAPIFPLKLKTMTVFSFKEYDYKRQGFHIRPHYTTPVRSFSLASRSSLADRFFWPINENDARKFLKNMKQDRSKRHDLDRRRGVLVVDYTLNGIVSERSKNKKRARLLLSVKPTRVAAYTNATLSRHITDFPLSLVSRPGMEKRKVIITDKPKSLTTPDNKKKFDILGVKIDMNLEKADGLLKAHYGDKGLRFEMVKPEKLLSETVSAMKDGRIEIPEERKEGALKLLEQLSIRQVAFPGIGINFHTLEKKKTKEEITVFASTIGTNSKVVSIARRIQFNSSLIDVNILAKRAVTKYGRPSYRSSSKQVKYPRISMHWAQSNKIGAKLAGSPLDCTRQFENLFKNRGNRDDADEYLTAYAKDLDQPLYNLNEEISTGKRKVQLSELFKIPWRDVNRERPKGYLETRTIRPEYIERRCGTILTMVITPETIWSTLVDTDGLKNMHEHMNKNHEKITKIELNKKQESSNEVKF